MSYPNPSNFYFAGTGGTSTLNPYGRYNKINPLGLWLTHRVTSSEQFDIPSLLCSYAETILDRDAFFSLCPSNRLITYSTPATRVKHLLGSNILSSTNEQNPTERFHGCKGMLLDNNLNIMYLVTKTFTRNQDNTYSVSGYTVYYDKRVFTSSNKYCKIIGGSLFKNMMSKVFSFAWNDKPIMVKIVDSINDLFVTQSLKRWETVNSVALNKLLQENITPILSMIE